MRKKFRVGDIVIIPSDLSSMYAHHSGRITACGIGKSRELCQVEFDENISRSLDVSELRKAEENGILTHEGFDWLQTKYETVCAWNLVCNLSFEEAEQYFREYGVCPEKGNSLETS